MRYYREPKSTFRAMVSLIALLLFTLIFGSLLCGLWFSHMNIRVALNKGLDNHATLENKEILAAQDGSLEYWFTYHFTTETGDTYQSSIEVSQSTYDNYTAGDSLAMRYSPDNPRYNTLLLMQEDIQNIQSTINMLGLVVIVGIVSLAFVTVRSW